MSMEHQEQQEERSAVETPAGPPPSPGGRLRGIWGRLRRGKKRKWIAVLLVLAIAGGAAAWHGRGSTAEAAAEYQEAAVERRSITNSLSASGTLEPADSYTVNTLVSGEILSDTFENGDQVEEGQLLYTIDSSNASSSQTQAQNSYAQAQTNYQQAVEAKYPEVDMSGTVAEVYVQNGESVSAGTELLRIVGDNNLSLTCLFPYASPSDFYVGQSATIYIGDFEGTTAGTVTAVSASTVTTSTGLQAVSVQVEAPNPGLATEDYTATVNIGQYTSYGQTALHLSASSTVKAEVSGKVTGLTVLAGDSISAGTRICNTRSSVADNAIESARISLSNAATSLESAQKNLEDYSITAPISGTVVTKNAKAGDNIEGGSDSTLCVIYDMSYLEMTMSIDELDIGSVAAGQEVRITADAVEDQVYTGVVTEVSVAGTTSGGITTYPVTVRIDETDGLLPGMNVDAEIVVSSSDSALAIPAAAVSRGDKVLVTADSPSAADALEDEAPEGYVYVAVETGVSDGSYIEVLSGLQEGDTVAYLQLASSSGGESGMMMGGMPSGGMPGGMSGGGMPGGGGGMPSGGPGGF